MKSIAKMLIHILRVVRIDFGEMLKDIRYCGFHRDRAQKLGWRMLLLAHSLEKGLGIPNRRVDFGRKKAQDLLRYLRAYCKEKLPEDAYAYQEARAVLKLYLLERERNRLSNDEFDQSILGQEEISVQNAGCVELTRADVAYEFADFERLCGIRHSVREFSDRDVSGAEIKRAAALMAKAPSACNRQMIHLYCSMCAQDNARLAELVPGNTGFETQINKYLFLTADRTAFDDVEIGQWYVNGGIYVAYLQLAFTAQMIGSCVFQWPKDKRAETSAKEILKIPNHEMIVSVLGIGHYKERFRVLKSARKPVSNFITFVREERADQ